jgi:predicted kinase
MPVVSLDAIRTELGVDPARDQRAVVDAGYQRAREHLRAGRSFVWNATNVSREHRERCTGLIADYRGRVELVAVETSPEVLRERNRARSAPVPAAVIDRLVRRWNAPDLTEAHTLTWLTS